MRESPSERRRTRRVGRGSAAPGAGGVPQRACPHWRPGASGTARPPRPSPAPAAGGGASARWHAGRGGGGGGWEGEEGGSLSPRGTRGAGLSAGCSSPPTGAPAPAPRPRGASQGSGVGGGFGCRERGGQAAARPLAWLRSEGSLNLTPRSFSSSARRSRSCCGASSGSAAAARVAKRAACSVWRSGLADPLRRHRELQT